MKRVLASLLLALSLGLAGCGIMPGVTPNLESTGWRAVQVWGREPVAGREPTVRFAGGKVVGSGGCNQIGGQFTIDGARLTVTDLGGTAMGCPAPIGEIEGAFMKALLTAETIRFDGQNLVILGVGGEVVLRPDPTVR
ncbi:MAG: META domain-containing protein [Chloroflexota bacterium]|nr:META domain-containing protein [Chloroflexota bacterium]